MSYVRLLTMLINYLRCGQIHVFLLFELFLILTFQNRVLNI